MKQDYCFSKRIDGCEVKENQGQVFVEKLLDYDPKEGYGFIPFSEKGENHQDFFRGLGGWSQGDHISNESIIQKELTSKGVLVDSIRYPLRFRALVKEQGNYKVTLVFERGSHEDHELRIYLGRRNMIEWTKDLKPNETYRQSSYVHIGEYIPIVGRKADVDTSIYISLLGRDVYLQEIIIEKVDVPTLFIGGDSIVADYPAEFPYNPLITGGAWGQYLAQYIDGMAIDNQAHGGMTTDCFRDDGHLEIIEKTIKPGDIFLFQFGHNDQKRRHLGPFTGYTWNLRWYIALIREHGGIPIIVTSMSRIPSLGQKGYYDLLGDYEEACLRVGKELEVPVVNLHAKSFQYFCSIPRNELQGYFNDAAHTNDYGGYMVAGWIARMLEELGIEALKGHVHLKKASSWLPDDSLRPKDLTPVAEKEEAPILSHENLPQLPYADCRDIRDLDLLRQAMQKGLLDPCIKFFHPFESIPRAQFLYIFFKAFKMDKGQEYQGGYCDIGNYEFDAGAVQQALDRKLIDPTTTSMHRFRPDEALTCGELVSFVIRALQDENCRQLDMRQCEKKAQQLGLIWENYNRYDRVKRLDCVITLVHAMNIG